MDRTYHYSHRKNHMMRLTVILYLAFITLSLAGQKPVDFSGTWTEDHSKGKSILEGYNLIITITQTDKTISIKHAYFNDKGKEEDSMLLTYDLDGKEMVKKESGWVERQSLKWVPDKKEITIKSTQTMESQVVESYEIYTLSENGNVMTLKRYNIQAKDKPYISIFNRKK